MKDYKELLKGNKNGVNTYDEEVVSKIWSLDDDWKRQVIKSTFLEIGWEPIQYFKIWKENVNWKSKYLYNNSEELLNTYKMIQQVLIKTGKIKTAGK